MVIKKEFLNSANTAPSASQNFYNSMPAHLRAIIDRAMTIQAVSADTPARSIALIDNTSLSNDDNVPMLGNETSEKILNLCQSSVISKKSFTAAVCVYPNHIALAKGALAQTRIKLAVVNNFPHGDLSADWAAKDAAKSAQMGADEIDTVLDYRAFLAGDIDGARAKLNAVADATHQNNATLKTILKASVYETYDVLYSAAKLAIECKADFVKTCTGKIPLTGYGTGEADASTLMTAATVMQTVADHRAQYPNVGVKISGGVKTAIECERMRFLVGQILGEDYYKPERFRFGASSLLGNLSTPKSAQKAGPKPSNY